MATHSSILAWRIPWRDEPGRLQSMGCKESDMTERHHFHFQEKQKRLRRCDKNTQKNYTKKVLMTQIIMMVWSLT